MTEEIVSLDRKDLKIFEGRILTLLGDIDAKLTRLEASFRVAYFNGDESVQEDDD